MRFIKTPIMILAVCTALPTLANPVKVKMDSNSPTMTLVNKATGATVQTGAPASLEYSFDVAPGLYIVASPGHSRRVIVR